MSYRRSGAYGTLLVFLLVGGTALTGAAGRRPRLSLSRPEHHMGTVSLTTGAAAASSVAPSQLARKTAVNAIFRPVLPRLKKVIIPVLLPTILPGQPQATGTLRLYAEVSDLTSFSYRVALGFAPGCQGGAACRFGEVTGGAVSDTPTIFDYPRGRHVRLRGGALALFFPYSRGASCGDSVLVFQVQGIVYTVSRKAGSLPDVLAMANSVAAP